MKSSKWAIIAAVLAALAFIGLKQLEKLPYRPPYHDPIFDKVLPKEPTLADLKAIRARREPLVENPTEEDIAFLKADIAEYRARYEANIVCKARITDFFTSKYDYYSKYREAIKPLIDELAAQGDMFALSASRLRSGNTWLIGQEVARLGEITHMASEGWFLATGFMTPRDAVLGEKYLTEAADRGSYSAHKFLVEYYHRYKYLDKLCLAAKDAYKSFGLEVFQFNIQKNHKMMEYIQNNCHVFSDKEYTSEEMKFNYLRDIDTDESRLMQAMILSNTGVYDMAKAMFEELENNKDQKIRANAQLCLSRMYYNGAGVGKDESLATYYGDKAFNNGSYTSKIYMM
jgi:hypothetical protein